MGGEERGDAPLTLTPSLRIAHRGVAWRLGGEMYAVDNLSARDSQKHGYACVVGVPVLRDPEQGCILVLFCIQVGRSMFLSLGHTHGIGVPSRRRTKHTTRIRTEFQVEERQPGAGRLWKRVLRWKHGSSRTEPRYI